MKLAPHSHQVCPFCHTPVARARYEFASDGQHTWRICPECDHILLMTDEESGTTAASLKQTAIAHGAHESTASEPLHA